MAVDEKITVRRENNGELFYSKRGAIVICKGGAYYGLTNREQLNIIILIIKITVERIYKWSIKHVGMLMQFIKR